MTAHQMICHLSDSFRSALGEKQISSSSTLFKRTIYKWAALWVPLPWPHGIKTRPEMDQQQGGTQPVEFASDAHTSSERHASVLAKGVHHAEWRVRRPAAA